MTTSISFGGLASGLDTGSIVAQLVAIRRAPITRYQEQKTDLNRGLSILNDLKAQIERLGEIAAELDARDQFVSKAATSNDEGVLLATATSDATLGRYAITINNLATAHRETSQGYAASTDSVGAGTFSITIDGATTDVTLAAGADSLADLKAAINDANLGVNASIINDGTAYRLVLSADETGTAHSFTVDASGLGGGTAPTFTTRAATDASLDIDGIAITSSSNQVEGAIEGVTLDLQATGTANLTVDTDSELLLEKLQDLVDGYNEVVGTVNAQSEMGAALNGSTLIRTIQSRLTSILTRSVDTGGDFRMLAEVGITLANDGTLSLDRDELEESLGSDFESVVSLFVDGGATQGVASQLSTLVDDLTDYSGGLFKIREDAINDQIENIDDRIEREERSVAAYEELLNYKFSAMERLISDLQAQSGFLNF